MREKVGKSGGPGEIRIVEDQPQVVEVDEFVVDNGDVRDESQREESEADGVLEPSV